MVTDIGTVLWKEIKEIFVARPNLRGGWVGMLVFVGVFGILFPLQTGSKWLSSIQAILISAWVPFILVNSVVADSFAGERERHTLETLLASRLSDRAILLGKIAASILYGWGMTLAMVLLSLVTVNVAFWEGKVRLFPLTNGLAVLAFSFLVALLSAALGVLVSLRAKSVRQAQQTLSIAMFAVLIPLLILPVLPADTRIQLVTFFTRLEATTVAWAVGGLLAAVDAILVAVGIARFQRSRLIIE